MTKKRQLPNPNCPPRTKWKEFCEFVLAELSYCDGQNRGNVIRHAHRQQQIFVVEITCTYEVYMRCILPVLTAYEGNALGFKPHDDKPRLGQEYDYPIIFTPRPMDAINYYIVDGTLFYRNPDEE